MSNELKPCPFCGEEVQLVTVERIDNEGYADSMTYVDCENHNMVIRPDEWNRRPIEDALKTEIERLRSMLKVKPC